MKKSHHKLSSGLCTTSWFDWINLLQNNDQNRDSLIIHYIKHFQLFFCRIMLKLFRNRLWSQYFLRIFTIEPTQNYEILTNIPNNQPSKSTLNELSRNLFVLADFQPLWKAFKANGSLKYHSNYNPFRLPLTTKKTQWFFSFSDLK